MSVEAVWANRVYHDRRHGQFCYIRLVGKRYYYMWNRRTDPTPLWIKARAYDEVGISLCPPLTRLFALLNNLEFRVNLGDAKEC